MKTKSKNTLVIVLVVLGIMFISFSFYFYQIIFTPNLLVDEGDRSFYIHSGATFDEVRNALYEGRYLNDVVSFGFLAKLMDYDKAVKPGHYIIKGNSTNIETIRMLRAGEQTPVNITFSNVRLIEELSEKVCANVELEPAEFDSLLLDPETPGKYGFEEENFKTMFIPNTYEVYWTISAEDLLDRFKKEYDAFWNEERRAKAEEIGLTRAEVSVLASIVQAESRHRDESPVIAGLYLNRLKKGMLLQADPTLVYAIGDFNIQRVLNAHKTIDSPYNTYKFVGLPPGPINFPSITSLDAVLNHEKHNYLYMCAKEDFSGYHNFTASLSQHMQNARRFQQALNNAKIYK